MTALHPYIRPLRRFFLSHTALRVSAFLIGITIFVSDYIDGVFEGLGPLHFALYALAYLPLIAVAISDYLGIFVWIAVWIVVGLNPLHGALNQVSLVLPATLSCGLIAYLLPWRKATWYGAFTLALLVLTPVVISPFDKAVLLVSSIGVILALISGLVINWFQQSNQQTRSELVMTQAKQEQIRREERIKLAHELHDIVAHEITLIAMQTQRAQHLKDAGQTDEILRSIGQSAQQALEDLRSLVTLLKNHDDDSGRTSILNNQDLLEVGELSGETTNAESLTNDLQQITKALESLDFSVNLEILGDVERIPRAIRQALRRTAREMGTNVFKHGDASVPVDLSLQVGGREVRLKTRNGMCAEKSPISSTQTGLEAMNTRCISLGGELTVVQENDRWITEASYPLIR